MTPPASSAQSGENVFTMMRRIGQAKAELAADYAAQLGPQRRQGRLLRCMDDRPYRSGTGPGR